MDSVMEKVAGREWHYEALSLPLVGHLPISEIAEPITIEQFLQAACHRCDHVKSTTILFDVHFEVSEFGGVARGSYRKVNLIICLFSFVSVANFLQT